jgi:hypothetical protein
VGFYPSFFWYEFLTAPNSIVEDPRPVRGAEGSAAALDTLYEIRGGAVPEGEVRPAMTFYHGIENPPLVFSGFPLWDFRRTDCQQLVDAVLQGVWGLSRSTGPSPRPKPVAQRAPISRAARSEVAAGAVRR